MLYNGYKQLVFAIDIFIFYCTDCTIHFTSIIDTNNTDLLNKKQTILLLEDSKIFCTSIWLLLLT